MHLFRPLNVSVFIILIVFMFVFLEAKQEQPDQNAMVESTQ